MIHHLKKHQKKGQLSNFKLILLMVVNIICILFYYNKAAMQYEGIIYENTANLSALLFRD